jgi:hypothetical protein
VLRGGCNDSSGDGEIVGCCSVLHRPMWAGQEVVQAAWLTDFAFDARSRGIGLGYVLLSAVAREHELPLSISCTPQLELMFRSARLPALNVDVLERAVKPAPRLCAVLGVTSELVEVFTPEIDGFWRRVRTQYALISDRSAGTLNWQFAGNQWIRIRAIVARVSGGVAGYMVVACKVADERGMRGVIVDLLIDGERGEVLRELVRQAWRIFEDMGVSTVELICPSSGLREQFQEIGFRRGEWREPFYVCRPLAGRLMALDLGRLYLTGGDSELNLWE